MSDSWRENLCRAINRYIPWQLPDEIPALVLRLDPVMSDDDVNAWNDILYFRGLTDEIRDECIRTSGRLQPLPTILSTTLDLACELVRSGFSDGPVQVALLDWRAETTEAAA